MLRAVEISKSVYDALPEEKKLMPETMFLCKDETTGLCSIFIKGKCYGEDIDADKFLNKTDIADWAKEPTKPTYTAEEVQAVNRTDSISIVRIREMFDSLQNT